MPLIDLVKKANFWLECNHWRSARIFRCLVYAWVIFNTLTHIPYHDLFWGENSWVQDISIEQFSVFNQALNLLSFESVAPYYLGFLVLQIIFSGMAMAGRYSYASSLLVWFLTMNLDNKIFTTMDGGNNLMHLMLFYCIFISPDKLSRKRIASSSLLYISNLAFLTARLQLCVVYFVAGHLKMTGTYWTNGMAFYYVMGVDEYSLPILNWVFTAFPLLSILASYATIMFQISFPLLIWFKEVRPLLFVVGGFMHIGIALGMGLISFGLAMVVCYAAFFTSSEILWYEKLGRMYRKVVVLGLARLNCSWPAAGASKVHEATT